MNPFNVPAVDAPITAASLTCVCHNAADCPDQATVAIDAGRLTEVGELLEVIDEFLRTQPGAAEMLTDHLAARAARAHPLDGLPCTPGYLRGQARYEVSLLIDAVGFAAHALRTHRTDRGGDR